MEDFGLGKIGEKFAKQALQVANEHHEAVANDVRHELIENTVTKSNFLARSSYEFSLVDKRVMEMMISKLNPIGMELNIYRTVDIELYATEYAQATQTDAKTAYRELSKSVTALLHTVITVGEANDKIMRPLMFEAEYKQKEGKIVASFHPKFLSHLIGLREQFTKYALADVLRFKSEYTWRIYEMSMSVKNSKNRTFGISVSDLRDRLAIPESYRWINLKRVIEKAQLEIKTKTSYELVVSMKKTGREFTWLEFTISKKSQTELDV